MIRAISIVFLLFAAPLANAAASAQALTSLHASVLGNETKTFSVRFLDAAGQASAHESVQFVNDACGWFPNGSSVASMRTDANGVASIPFTAFNQGITCWLIASAGAQVRFDVLTYTMSGAIAGNMADSCWFHSTRSPRSKKSCCQKVGT